MKRILFLLLLFVNLQVVWQCEIVSFSFGSAVCAQSMGREDEDIFKSDSDSGGGGGQNDSGGQNDNGDAEPGKYGENGVLPEVVVTPDNVIIITIIDDGLHTEEISDEDRTHFGQSVDKKEEKNTETSEDDDKQDQDDKSVIPVFRVLPTVNCFASYSILKDCMTVAKAIMNNMKPDMSYGGSDCFFHPAFPPRNLKKEEWKENEKLDFDSLSAAAGLDCIKEHIDSGYPIIVGVDEKKGHPSSNQDGVTDHWLVVYGYGVDEDGSEYIMYAETATGYESRQFDYFNRLYYDGTAITGIAANRKKNYTYIVTEIRPNMECPENPSITSYDKIKKQYEENKEQTVSQNIEN